MDRVRQIEHTPPKPLLILSPGVFTGFSVLNMTSSTTGSASATSPVLATSTTASDSTSTTSASSQVTPTHTTGQISIASGPSYTTPTRATILGVGEGTGRGLLIGDGISWSAFLSYHADITGVGTVYLGGIIPVRSSGIASGGGIVKGQDPSPINLLFCY
jgi:hypothetical protein